MKTFMTFSLEMFSMPYAAPDVAPTYANTGRKKVHQGTSATPPNRPLGSVINMAKMATGTTTIITDKLDPMAVLGPRPACC